MNAWPALLKRPTLAKYLEVSLPSLEKELAAGRLPRPIMFGGTLHWRKTDVDEAISVRALDPAADARKQFEENLDKLRSRAA